MQTQHRIYLIHSLKFSTFSKLQNVKWDDRGFTTVNATRKWNTPNYQIVTNAYYCLQTIELFLNERLSD